ncbi:hypothetical protein JCM3766R1_006939 [Sporobolomyces carnicolor]
MNRLKNSLALLSTSSTGGAAAAAADDEDHEQRRTIISTRRDVLDSVKATSTLYHKHWSKRRPDPRSSSSSRFKTNKDQQQQLATKWFSLALADVASLEPRSHDSGYYSIVSDCLSKVDDISVRYVGRFEREFVDPLDRRIDQCRTFEHSVKRLDKKRDQFRKLKHSSESDNNKSVDFKKKDDVQHELEQLEWEVTDATDDVDRQFREIQLAAARDDVESLKNLIEAQLEFAKAWTTVLERARDEFDNHHHDGNNRNAPFRSTATTIDDDDGGTRSRASPSAATSSSIASTRMNRSHSDSSGGGGGRHVVSGVAMGATNLLSSLGPGRRSRRSTVSTSSSDHDKGNNAMNRSRSGSVLERFALGSSSSSSKGDGDRVSSSSDRTEPVGGESKNRSRSGSGSGSSKWTSSPSLASLARMKPFGSSASPSSPSSSSPSSKRYGALRDEDELSPYARGVGRLGRDDDDDGSGAAAVVALDPYREPEAPSTTTATAPKRRPPPPLHRTRTAPPATTTTTTTPRRLSPIGQTFVAKWSFDPTRTGGRGDDELKLDKGDLVVVEDVVNRDWWIGRLVEGEGEGETRRGMFPSLYVALHEEEEEETTTDDDDEQGLVAAKSPFE